MEASKFFVAVKPSVQTLQNVYWNAAGNSGNMYNGPTETTIWSTTERLSPGQIITIGRPIANTQVYILDGTLSRSRRALLESFLSEEMVWPWVTSTGPS